MSEDTASLISDCSTFLIFGIMMGCLLIVASVMMCLLAYRLNTMATTYKVRDQYYTVGLIRMNPSSLELTMIYFSEGEG